MVKQVLYFEQQVMWLLQSWVFSGVSRMAVVMRTWGMRTFEAQVTVSADRRLMIELPEGVEAGSYQIVVVMNRSDEVQVEPQAGRGLNGLAGRVRSFAAVDAVSWQRQVRAEWDDA